MCSKSFSRKHDLSRHEKVHGNNIVQVPSSLPVPSTDNAVTELWGDDFEEDDELLIKAVNDFENNQGKKLQ